MTRSVLGQASGTSDEPSGDGGRITDARSSTAAAPVDPRDRAAPRGYRTVRAALLGAQALLLVWIASRSYFFSDDLLYGNLLGSEPLNLHLLIRSWFGHLVPGFIAADWTFIRFVGLDWGVAAVIMVAVALVGRFADRIDWPGTWVVNIADPVNNAVDWMTDHLYSGVPYIGGTADWAGHFTTWVLDPIRDGLQWLPWWSVLLIVAALAWLIGTWRTAVTAVLAMAAIGVLGVWKPSLDTLSQVLAAVAVTLVVGFAVGIGAARSERVERLLRPVLDVFQTMPQFVYLIPVVALFGVGRAPAVAAAVVYALPAVIRITTQGLRQVDGAAMESARSMGATSGQQLRQVQLPLARPALLLAVNQGVVLVLAVVIIGGLVGGGALGYEVVFGLAQGDLATGLVGGAAIVCLGLMLDRVTQPTERRAKKGA